MFLKVIPTILAIILLMMTEKTLKVKTTESRRYQTKTHVIDGVNIGVEHPPVSN